MATMPSISPWVAASQAVRDLFEQRQAQAIAEEQRRIENEQRSRQIAVSEGSLGLNRDRFGFERDQWGELAPSRAANLANVQALTQRTADVNRRENTDWQDARELSSLMPVEQGDTPVSPRLAFDAQRLTGLNLLTPSAQQSFMTPEAIGSQSGRATLAETLGGGAQSAAILGRIQASNRPQAQGAAAGGQRNLAALAAKSPDVLQGLTPTMVGDVMKEIAADPELLAQYESTRMAPLRERSKTILSTLDQLVSTQEGKPALTPGARAIFGEFTPVAARSMIPGKSATDANAALQQLLGQQIVDLIADMKSQSRTGATGFGALSVRELDVLQAAATQLTQRLSEPAALRELMAIKTALDKVMQESGGQQQQQQQGGGRRIGRFEVVE